ncbi:MAG: ParB N-terminal domain-containing protein [Nitrososphaeraceae archaeon]
MKPQIRISSECASLVPGLSPEVYESLKQSIKEENSLYVPIIINQNGIIHDGHHRYKACQELGIEPKTLVKGFKDKLADELFVINCNLIRRQLNNFQKTELALKSKPLLEAIVKGNESLSGKGGKGGRNLTPLGRVDDRVGERASVSRDTVRKVEKILESKRITDNTKEDLRSGKVSINEAYEMVVLDQECQSLYQKCLKAFDELKKSDAEIDNQPERTKEETERLRAKGDLRAEIRKAFRNNFEKRIERDKACAAFYFWYEYRINKNNDIESVASDTLSEIVRLGTENEMQKLPWQKIEQIIDHAVIENKVNVNEVRNSKAIQAKLELLRQEQEAGDKD